ncbi:MAG TPA: hypothetical protein VJ570_02575 [Holophagaceae bacterium]|nr:hypothetical protein [Holophagaceae bacterium]
MTTLPILLLRNRRQAERRLRPGGPWALPVGLLRVGSWRFLRATSWPVLLVAPIIYGALLPALLLDLYVGLYQLLCCSIYGIPRTKRSDHLILDRAKLPYLNLLEKAGCLYCSYFNGLVSYAQEVAGRTEQRFCPIRHQRRPRTLHARYSRFLEYGDAEGYRRNAAAVQKDFTDLPPPA